MKNNLFKKSMSVFLSVLMIMSCWVFVPGEHNHASAADLEAASVTYNKAMLNEINTNVDYNVNTTGNFYKFKIYGNGDDGPDNTTERQLKYYKNLLSHDAGTSMVGDNNRGAYFNNVTNSELTVSIAYPTMVLKYDGVTTPKFGIMLEADSTKNKTVRFERAWMDANSNGLSFNPNYWLGIANDDSAYFYCMDVADHKYTLRAQDTNQGGVFNARKSGQWEFLAASLEFTDSMSIGEWTRTISPTWKFSNGSTTYTGTTNSTIYVMNFKGYGELLTRINNHKNDLLNNAAQYTPESIRTYVDAAKAITNLNPKNYTGINQAASWGSQMNTAYTNYNNAVNGLAKRQYEVTYDNMFSLADWRYSQSLGDANYVSVNLNEGKVTITNPNTSEFTTPMSGSSSNANTRDTRFYAMPVVGGQEYTIKYTTDGSDTQMFAFFYDNNGGCTHSGTYGNYNFAVKSGTGQATFKAPDNSTQMEIRFDNNIKGTANFWDIMIYPASLKTDLEIDSWTARPHRALYNYNASVGTLQTPERPGYKFDKWMEDTDGDGIGDAAPTGTITSSRVLYSSWTVDNFTLTFDAAGGNATATSVVYSPEGSVQMPTVTRDGYAFDGWKVTTAGGNWNAGDTYEAGQILTGKIGNATLTAQWVNEWTVTYYYGDNTTVLATVKVKDGETVGSLPTVTPTKETTDEYSYSFKNWKANDAAFTASTKVTSDLKVYPVFDNVPHTFVWADNTHKNATCDAPALVHKYCSGCGYSLGNVPYDGDNANWLAKGHDYSGDAIKIEGNDDQHAVKCVRYGKDGCTATELFDHTWTGDTSEGATCTIPGTVKKSCPCGAEKFVDGEIDENAHNFDYTVGTPNGDNETHTVNCTYNTAHTETVACKDDDNNCYCDICGQELIHVYDEKTKDFEASKADCYNDATYYLTCQCGKQGTETWTDEGSKLKHNWTDTEKYLKSEADCENDEVYYKECSLCNVSSKDITGATWSKADTATGHDYTGEIRDNNNGTHSYLCKNDCGTYGYNKVKDAATDCTYGEWTKNEADTHTKTCTECKYAVTEDHSFTKWVTVDGATNTAAAEHTRECTVCDRTETTGCTYTSVETKVTCTTDGYTTHTCNICKHVYVTPGTTATGHDYTGAVQSLNNGTHNYLCKNGCGTYGYETVENAFADCDYKYENDAADGEHQATCKECGYSFAEDCSGGQATCTAAAVCEKCNVAYGTTVPHSFEGAVVVLEGDFHAYLCEFCGDTTGIKGVGSTVDAKEACAGGSATCTALAICEKCGDTHGELDADAHKWGTWANVEGTETHKRICEYDNAHTEEAECFSPDNVVIAPDCETPGYTLNTCEICAHEWHTAPTEALGHDWSAWVNNEDGTHTRTCQDETCKYGKDGGAKVETADCTKENAEAVVTEPTCTEGGYTTYTCKDCGYVWTADATKATGHSYTEKTKKTDSKYLRSTKDCVTDWTYWYCCDNCDVSAETEKDKYENEADLYWVREAAAGHKYDAKTATEDYLATEATCTEKATYYYSCSVCGTSSEDTADEKTFEHGTALNHDWQDTETYLKSEADCINNEVYYKECSRCHISSENETGATWEKADTKSGHDFDHDNDGVLGNEGDAGYTKGVAATCTDEGVVEHYTCKVCNKHFKADKTTEIAADKLTIAALKHDFKDVAAKAATCEEAGYTKHKQCQREGCGYRNTDYKVIPALGHEYKAENGYYTDKENNKHAYYCTNNCGTYGIDNVKNATVDCVFDGEYVQYDDENGVHSHKKACVCGNEQSAACADAEPEHKAPTCTEDGYYVHVCDVCSFEWIVESDAEADKALNHKLVIVPNNNGTHSAKCERENCDYVEAAEKCSTATPATNCGEYDVCDICKTAFGEAKPHVFTDYKYNNDAKCGVNGTETAVCDTCKGEEKATHTRTAEGTALKHVMTEDYTYDLSAWKGMPEDFDTESIKKPTCHSEGLSITYCTNVGCDYHKTKSEKADSTAHVWPEEWTEVGGDCANGLTMVRKCTAEGCNAVQSKTEKVPHSWDEIVRVEADCTHAGYSHYKCTACGFVQIVDEAYELLDEEGNVVEEYPTFNGKDTGHKAALGHDYSAEMVVEKAATCGKDGRGYHVCQRCNEAGEKEVIPATGHDWDKNNDGITDEGFVPSMIDAKTTLYVEPVESTCQIDGHNGYYKCFNCSYDQSTFENWKKDNFFGKAEHADDNNDGKCDECNSQFYGEDDEKNCGCICHKEGWFMKFIYKIIRFFWKLFGIGKACECGTTHY